MEKSDGTCLCTGFQIHLSHFQTLASSGMNVGTVTGSALVASHATHCWHNAHNFMGRVEKQWICLSRVLCTSKQKHIISQTHSLYSGKEILARHVMPFSSADELEIKIKTVFRFFFVSICSYNYEAIDILINPRKCNSTEDYQRQTLRGTQLNLYKLWHCLCWIAASKTGQSIDQTIRWGHLKWKFLYHWLNLLS